jgi:hypothetical protein
MTARFQKSFPVTSLHSLLPHFLSVCRWYDPPHKLTPQSPTTCYYQICIKPPINPQTASLWWWW